MSLINRGVKIYHYVRRAGVTERLLWGQGILIQFAQDYEDRQNGVGTFPVGIVELLDGRIMLVNVNLLEFIQT